MTIINVMVDDQRLEFSSMPVVASEGVKETYVKFALSSDWSGFGAVALFYRDDDEETVYESVLDGAGLAEVPYEVTAAPGWIRFGLSGSDGTSVHTSEILKYKVVKGKYTSGQGSEPPAPGIYEQMLAIAGQMRDTLNAALVDQNAIIHGLTVDMSALETEQDNYENVITGRINTLVANFAGSSRETVLFEGSHTVNIGDEIDLVSDPTVYDYLDIVLNDDMVGTIIGPTQNSQWRVTGETVKSTGTSVTTYVIEGVLDAQSLCLRVSTACAIVDTGTSSTRYDLGSGSIADESLRRYCLKVIGRKLTDDAEVLDIRVGADGTTYQTAGTAVRSQITALTDNLTKKLNTPLTSGGNADYGVSGQLLATDGTGNTEWVDNRGPSDEQVQTAVDAWLDDHPEATTTVQDNSLTYKKLVTGTLGYVTPEDYGAVGDGVTDDTQALQAAVNSGYPVQLDGSKIYIVTNITPYHGMIIDGNGATLKRPNLKEAPYNWTDSQIKWARFFAFGYSLVNTNDKVTVFRNITFDGNAWSMWSESDGYKYENAPFVAGNGISDHKVKFLFDGCHFKDNFASGVSCGDYTDATFINCTSTDCFKGMVTFVGFGSNLTMDNIKCHNHYNFHTINIEINFEDSENDPQSNVMLSNIYTEGYIKLGGMSGHGKLYVTNMVCKNCSALVISGGEVSISNTVFELTNYLYLRLPKDNLLPISMTFNNVTFAGIADPYTYVSIRDLGAENGKGAHVIFNSCVFLSLVRAVTVSKSFVSNNDVIFNQCVFNDITEGIIMPTLDSSRYFVKDVYFKNCKIDIADTAYISNNVSIEKQNLHFSENKILSANAGIRIYGLTNNILTFDNDIWDYGTAISYYRSSGNNPFVFGTRYRFVENVPTEAGFNDHDIAIVTSLNNAVYKYTNNAWIAV